jgi:hypothetical protein
MSNPDEVSPSPPTHTQSQSKGQAVKKKMSHKCPDYNPYAHFGILDEADIELLHESRDYTPEDFEDQASFWTGGTSEERIQKQIGRIAAYVKVIEVMKEPQSFKVQHCLEVIYFLTTVINDMNKRDVNYICVLFII